VGEEGGFKKVGRVTALESWVWWVEKVAHGGHVLESFLRIGL
jgi:hypothetical protein